MSITSEKLVEIFNRDIIEENLSLYKNLLETTTQATDPVWKAIIPIYIDFSKEQKEVFLNFLKIVEINTLSHTLGILDGSTYADGINDEFLLTTENSTKKLNEDLQSLFLELVEE
ncbi:hypothetical protein QE422_001709 [Chryseobacterium sp. SORGH_AS 447]|uniref:hypothetical protein n=1 Tax=Chryseobacterium sp. SORGH_AS_0447 TaxID=3041769 RepID=UPI00278123D3|nr:hypothetical protein [Chryseobacterium sp. SORGH_AS_0447]MDQ1161341.1 hypothetical protein [Chryseobacterium sp. SORGH_AS_0447]